MTKKKQKRNKKDVRKRKQSIISTGGTQKKKIKVTSKHNTNDKVFSKIVKFPKNKVVFVLS